MTQRWRTFIGIILVAAVTAILAIVLGYYSLKESFPKTRGSTSLAGLKEPVSVIRDSFFVPHIFAENLPDLYFAAGFVTAQDRLWQMELFRRTAAGRLSEIFGPTILGQDKFMRTLRIMDVARNLSRNISPSVLELLKAYRNGINVYIETNRKKLPIELNILNYQPEPWTEMDCLACLRLLNWNMSTNWYLELLYGALATGFSPDLIGEIWPDFTEAMALKYPANPALTDFYRFFLEMVNKSYLPYGAAENHLTSNCWVIAGNKSQSGKPLLAIDPHSPLTIPGVWYEMHWICEKEGVNISGLCYPGLPAILIGHNPSVAWGFNNAFIDDVDFIAQKIDSTDSSRYWLNGQWQKLQIHQEVMKVRGFDSLTFKIRQSLDGPIVSDLLKNSKNLPVIAMRWTGFERSDELKAFTEMLKARDVYQFSSALTDLKNSGLNFFFADTFNNIGARIAAQAPIYTQIIINPPDAQIIAHQKMIDYLNPAFGSLYREAPYRAEKIRADLGKKLKFTPGDLVNMQMDQSSLFAREWVPYFLNVMAAAQYKKDDIREQVYQLLKDWHHVETDESIPACLFNVFLINFLDLTFKDELKTDLFQAFLQVNDLVILALSKLCQKPDSRWFDDVMTPSVIETRDDIIRATIEKSIEFLRENLGSDLGDWRWSSLHTMTFKHPFGSRKILEIPFTIGPLPGTGGLGTVNPGSYNLAFPYKQMTGAGARMVVDLAHPDSAWCCLPLGQSGQLFNAHFKDQLSLWLSGRFHVMEKRPIRLQKFSEKLILKPEAKN